MMGIVALVTLLAMAADMAVVVTSGPAGGYKGNWFFALVWMSGAAWLAVWVLATQGI